MTLSLSDPIAPQRRGDGRQLSVASLDLLGMGLTQSPILMADDFRVRGHPFAPHPHAGFSAVTYVFEDSAGRLRSRDSLGTDHVVGRGGIVWTQAANGVMHEEMVADPGAELHGLQFFVNLTGNNKSIQPAVFALDGPAVPAVETEGGTRIHVVVGSFDGTQSPVRPADPFVLLDIELNGAARVDQPDDWFGLICARHGDVNIEADGRSRTLPAGMALAIEGGGVLRLQAKDGARPLYLAGPRVRESVVQHGPFIMRTADDVDAAAARFQRAEMERLQPLGSAQ